MMRLLRNVGQGLKPALLPVVMRELQVTARRSTTYRDRVIMAAGAVVLFVSMLFVVLPRSGIPPSSHGGTLFSALLLCAAIYGSLRAVMSSADLLSREKREGTLGLLFLTDLRGFDIVLGKLAASSVASFYALMAIVPVAAVCLQLGGVAATAFSVAVLGMANLLFCSLAIGLFVSGCCVDERKALFAAIGLLLLAVLGPPFVANVADEIWPSQLRRSLGEETALAILTFSPGLALVWATAAAAAPRGMPNWPCWVSLVLTHSIAWGLLWWTWRGLPWSWRVGERRGALGHLMDRYTQWIYGRGQARREHRRRLLRLHPLVWLMQRERGKPGYVWGYFVVVVGAWLIGNGGSKDVLGEVRFAIPGLLFIQFFPKIWVISESAIRLTEDRRVGALELLLSTSLSDREVVRGHWMALRRQFVWPVLIFALFEAWVLGGALGFWAGAAGAAVLLLDLAALGWAGLWLALRERSLTLAIMRSASLILVVPWGGVVLLVAGLERYANLGRTTLEGRVALWFWSWVAVGALVDAVVILWARHRVLTGLRRAAAEGPDRGAALRA